MRDAFRSFSDTIVLHGGIAHEIRGDALIAEFSRASDAISPALAFQSNNTAHNERLTDGILPVLRIGVAMGEVVIADNTVTGEGIVLAQRLEQLAEPGGICVQGAAYETTPKRLPFEYENLGERNLKGFTEPVRVYAVKHRSEVKASAPDASILSETVRPKLPDKPSIAVLPFTNMSGDPEQAYFAEGMAEDIITTLSKLKDWLVVARNSSFAYGGRYVDIREGGSELGVRYVLEGSVRRSGNRLRITGQLIEAGSGTHLWADRFDGNFDDVFALQDHISESVVGAIEPSLRRAKIERSRRKQPDDMGAYDLYLRAYPMFMQRDPKRMKKRCACCTRRLNSIPIMRRR